MKIEDIEIKKYYTTTEHLLNLFDRKSRQFGFKAENVTEYEAWKRTVKVKLVELTGIDRMEKCELQPRFLESEKMDGYRRDKLIIQTEPGVWMPFYVLIPETNKKAVQGIPIIATHGHSSGGKLSVVGRSEIDPIRKAIEKYNYVYGIELVRRGYIVFCPDARGFGERREWMHQKSDFLMSSSCMALNNMAISLGQSLTGMWIWDLMRLIDYIETRKDCDGGRLGCVGLSGGGLQTIWLAALDERVKAAVDSGYFYGYKDALLKLSNNCSCNYVPHLWETIDMGDLGALVAPRPLLIESGTQDPLNGPRGLTNVLEQLDITRRAYHLLGVEERLYHHIFEGDHRWNGEKSYDFLNKWLNDSVVDSNLKHSDF